MISEFQSKKPRTYSSKNQGEGKDICGLNILWSEQMIETIEVQFNSEQQGEEDDEQKALLAPHTYKPSHNVFETQIDLDLSKVIKNFLIYKVNGLVKAVKVVILDIDQDQDIVFFVGKVKESEQMPTRKFYNAKANRKFEIETEYKGKTMTNVSVKYLVENDNVQKADTYILSTSSEINEYGHSLIQSERFTKYSARIKQCEEAKELQDMYNTAQDIILQMQSIKDRAQLLLTQAFNTFSIAGESVESTFSQLAAQLHSGNGEFDFSEMKNYKQKNTQLKQQINAIQDLQNQFSQLLVDLQTIKKTEVFKQIQNYVGSLDQWNEFFDNKQKMLLEKEQLEEKRNNTEKIKKDIDIKIEELENIIVLIKEKAERLKSQFQDSQREETKLKEKLSQIKNSNFENDQKTKEDRMNEQKQRLEELLKDHEEQRQSIQKRYQECIQKFQKIQEQQIIQEAEEQTRNQKYLRNHFILCFDLSGSMEDSVLVLTSCYNNLKKFLKETNNGHLVSLIVFGTNSQVVFEQFEPSSMPELPTELQGGTNFKAAFRDVFSVINGTNDGLTPIVLFMTDGECSQDSKLLNEMKETKKLYPDLKQFTIYFSQHEPGDYLTKINEAMNNGEEFFKVNGQKNRLLINAKNHDQLIKAFQKITKFFQEEFYQCKTKQFKEFIEEMKTECKKEIQDTDLFFENKKNQIKQANKFWEDVFEKQSENDVEKHIEKLKLRLEEIEQQQKTLDQKLKEIEQSASEVKFSQNQLQLDKQNLNYAQIEKDIQKVNEEFQELETQQTKIKQQEEKKCGILFGNDRKKFLQESQYPEKLQKTLYTIISNSSTLSSIIQMSSQELIGQLEKLSEVQHLKSLVGEKQLTKELALYHNQDMKTMKDIVIEAFQNEFPEHYDSLKELLKLLMPQLDFIKIGTANELEITAIAKKMTASITPIKTKKADSDSESSDDSDEEEEKQSSKKNKAENGKVETEAKDYSEGYDTDLKINELRTEESVKQKVQELKEFIAEVNKKRKNIEDKKKKKQLKNKRKDAKSKKRFLETIMLNRQVLAKSVEDLFNCLYQLVNKPVQAVAKETIKGRLYTEYGTYKRKLIPKASYFKAVQQMLQQSTEEDIKKYIGHTIKWAENHFDETGVCQTKKRQIALEKEAWISREKENIKSLMN